MEKQLYSEKRTVFSGWLKAVFVGQALIAIVLGGFAAYDAFPTFTIDLSLQALGFWSFWLMYIGTNVDPGEKVALVLSPPPSPIPPFPALFFRNSDCPLLVVSTPISTVKYFGNRSSICTKA